MLEIKQFVLCKRESRRELFLGEMGLVNAYMLDSQIWLALPQVLQDLYDSHEHYSFQQNITKVTPGSQ
jgi:hypothetical protein